MRRTLGALLLAILVLAGCGDDSDGGAAEDPRDSPSTSQSPEATPAPTPDPTRPDGRSGGGWRLVEIVHATAVDGRVSTTPTPIGDGAAVAEFSEQFTRPQMQAAIARVVRDHEPTPGTELVAAVIAIGCDEPSGVTYVDGEIRPLKPPSPGVQCLAPVTFVAVVEVDH